MSTHAAHSHTTTRTSAWRGPLPIVAGAVIWLALIGVWRLTVDPAPPSHRVKLDPATQRFVDVEGAVAPLYLHGRAPKDGLLVVGDSRIGSDISIRTFEKSGLGPTGTLWNGLAQLDHVLRGARTLPPRRLVVCVTPASVFSPPLPHMATLLAQERAVSAMKRIDERLDDELDVWRRRTFRTWEPNPWSTEEAVVIQPERHELFYHALLAPQTRAERERKLAELRTRLCGLIEDGWRVACVRLPASPAVEAIEDEGFPPENFRRLCAELEIPYFDMFGGLYETGDGSHLLGADAERASREIAAWLKTLPRMQRR